MLKRIIAVLLLLIVAPKAFAQFSNLGDVAGVMAGKDVIPDLPAGWKVILQDTGKQDVQIDLQFYAYWPKDNLTEAARERGKSLGLHYTAKLSREEGKIVAQVTSLGPSFSDIQLESEPQWEIKPSEFRVPASGNRQMQMQALIKAIFGNGVAAAKIMALEKAREEIRAKAMAIDKKRN